MRIPQVGKALAISIAIFLGVSAEKSFAVSPPVLLTIDDSNPSAVTITTTGIAPAVNSVKNLESGVDLVAFFTTGQTGLFNSFFNSSLSGGNSGMPYLAVRSDNYSTSGGNFNDLNMFDVAGSRFLQDFTTLQPAFSGSWTLDLSSLGVSGAALPSPGAQGDILTGNSVDQGAVIGQWQVVPEPGMGSLFILSSIIAVATKRRRK